MTVERMRACLLAATVALLVLVPPRPLLAGPASGSGGPIVVREAWARALPPGVPNGAAYLVLENRGERPVTLEGVRSPVARRAEIHQSIVEGGMARMKPAGPLTIRPGETLTLEPGGYHVMLMGLMQPLSRGSRFPLTLELEPGGAVTVEVEVRRARMGRHGAPAGHGVQGRPPAK